MVVATICLYVLGVPTCGWATQSEFDDASVTVFASRDAASRETPAVATAHVVVRAVPVCVSGGALARCLRVPLVCPTGQQIVARYRGLATLPSPPAPGWTYLGQTCSGGATPTPAFTLTDFQRLPLPPGTFTIQPPGGTVLINTPTNVYADPAPTTLTTTTLGQTIHIEATPTTWTWTFGDGSTLGPTLDPGDAYPNLTNTHSYTAPGQYPLTMTTTYTGSYRTETSDWIPIDGTAQVTSPPIPITVLTARADLVS